MASTKLNAVLTWVAIAGMFSLGFRSTTPRDARELTVERLTVVDSAGNVRVILAGGFPPRRSSLAGLLFVHPSGVEAGGLVFGGNEEGGEVDAGALLTFDKYGDDQIVALQYREHDGQRYQGLVFQDRPDSLGQEILSYYRRIDPMPPGPARDSLVQEMLRSVPPDQLAARRMFLGRDRRKSSLITLSDRTGEARLRLEVDSLGHPSIVFLDGEGRVTKTIVP